MQELEKILEEISQEKLKHWDSSERLDTDKLIGRCFDRCIDIIRKHMNEEVTTNDLISRQALLDDFRHTITENSDTFDWLNMIARQPAVDKDDGWIPVDDRLPEEKVSPVTRDFYEYQVTANFGFGEDVRTYKYGNGHWWHGPGIVDKYVIAWRERPDPYYPKRRGK